MEVDRRPTKLAIQSLNSKKSIQAFYFHTRWIPLLYFLMHAGFVLWSWVINKKLLKINATVFLWIWSLSYSFPYDYDDKYLNQTKINKSFTSLTFFCSQSFSFNNWNFLRKVVFFTKIIRGETFFPLLYREIFSPSWSENVIKKTGKVWTSSQMETRRQTTLYVIFHIAGECTI